MHPVHVRRTQEEDGRDRMEDMGEGKCYMLMRRASLLSLIACFLAEGIYSVRPFSIRRDASRPFFPVSRSFTPVSFSLLFSSEG